MAKLLQLRRGNTAQHNTTNGGFTGAVGEVTVDTDKDTLVVHDGSTAGGSPLATANNPTFTGTVEIPNVANLETAVVANTAKNTNVNTDLSVSRDGTSFTVVSSDGTNASLPLADTDNWGVMSDEMFDKLTDIETSATADQTGAEIKTAYEAESDTNAFTDSEKTTLAGLVTNATHTGDVTGNTELTIADLAVETGMIADDAVTADKLAVAYAPLDAPALTGTATGDNLTLSGDLTVNGTTTTINSTTLQVEDKNIELGKVTSPDDDTANGGGITLKGATDKTILWNNSTESWDFNQHLSAEENMIIQKNLDVDGYIKKNASNSHSNPGALCTHISDTYLRVYDDPADDDDYKISLENTGAATFSGNVVSGTDWNSGDGVSSYKDGFFYVRNDSETGVVFAIQNGGNGTGGDRKASITGDGAATFAGAVTDAKGDVRNIPASTNSTLVAADAGKHISITDGITINAFTDFAIGDAVTIFNNQAAGNDETITATGIDLYLATDPSVSGAINRTLAPRGVATILCVAADKYVITGAGLS